MAFVRDWQQEKGRGQWSWMQRGRRGDLAVLQRARRAATHSPTWSLSRLSARGVAQNDGVGLYLSHAKCKDTTQHMGYCNQPSHHSCEQMYGEDETDACFQSELFRREVRAGRWLVEKTCVARERGNCVHMMFVQSERKKPVACKAIQCE